MAALGTRFAMKKGMCSVKMRLLACSVGVTAGTLIVTNEPADVEVFGVSAAERF